MVDGELYKLYQNYICFLILDCKLVYAKIILS